MKVLLAVMTCVVVDDERDGCEQKQPEGNPLEDLVERMRREMQYGRDTVNWRDADGAKVA